MAKYKLPKIEELFDAGVHFGHQVRRWHPDMAKYIFGVRSGIHIIDLEQTHDKLKEAAEFLYEVAKTGKQIIFVGTKRQAKDIIALDADRSGALYVNDRWLGGTITNYRIIKKNMDKLVDLISKKESGAFSHYTKKERLLIDREIEKLNTLVGGIVGLQGTPAAIFVIDAKRERTVIREANKSNIPVVALTDTNSNPEGIDYLIPGNDDAIRSIAIIVKVLSEAVESGYEDYAKSGSKEEAKKEVSKDSGSKETGSKEKVKEKGKKKNEKDVKVTSSEAPHTTEEAGKKHVEKAEKGEEVEIEEEKEQKTDSKKSKKESKDKEPKKKSTKKKKKATKEKSKKTTEKTAKKSEKK